MRYSSSYRRGTLGKLIEEEREARKKRAEYLRCKKNRERNRKNKEKENAKKTA